MTPYVEAVAKNKSSKLTPAWKNGLQGIIDSYLGKAPTSFQYEGKTYTPQSFAASLGLDMKIISASQATHIIHFGLNLQLRYKTTGVGL